MKANASVTEGIRFYLQLTKISLNEGIFFLLCYLFRFWDMKKFSFAAEFPILSSDFVKWFYQFDVLMRNFYAMKAITYVLRVGNIVSRLFFFSRNEFDQVKVVYVLKAFIDFGNSRPK